MTLFLSGRVRVVQLLLSRSGNHAADKSGQGRLLGIPAAASRTHR